MKRPKIDPASHYTLTEAARATGMPRGVLDHGCRGGRLPFRQTEGGMRLLSGTVVLQLARDRDLRSFPKAYESPPGPAPNLGYEEEQAPQGRPAAPTAAERMGLLEKPSPQMVQAKERAEQAQLAAQADRAYLESQRAKLELNRLREEQEDRHRARQAARKAETEQDRLEQEAVEDHRRQQAERQRRAEQARREQRRHEEWLKQQVSLAVSEGRWQLFLYVPYQEHNNAEQRIAAALSREVGPLTPDSDGSDCSLARQAAVERALAPYKVERTIEESLREIPRYLERLYEDGYINLPPEDREFLAKRLQPRVKAALVRHAQGRSSELTEAEAVELVRNAVDRELKLA